MPANTTPIFGLTPNIGIAQGVLTANTTIDLTAGTIYLLFTAGSNGSWVDKCYIKSIGSNVPSLLRFWYNNGSTTGSAGNNSLFYDFNTPTTTASNTTPQVFMGVPFGFAMPASSRLYATIATGVAAGYDITTLGADF